jgi:putative flavoprotein involved in K+ transport
MATINNTSNKRSNKNTHDHYTAIIVGGGQAGLSMSYYLQKSGIDHLVVEKSTLANAWKDKRWDSFTLVTPNWQCDLPGHPYDGDDPHGFMNRQQINDYLDRFIVKVNPPAVENTRVIDVSELPSKQFQVITTAGTFTADQVIVSAGGYHDPIIPPMASEVPNHIHQIHSEQYKNGEELPNGAVLVVGSGQSGAQIAEDLHLTGKKVFLATGDAPRCARFYRGKDVVDWLAEMEYYDMPIQDHPLREGVRDNTNHYVTGRDGGRDIDLRQFAQQGMELFGHLTGYDGENVTFSANLVENLNKADDVYHNINRRIDNFIEKSNIDAPVEAKYEATWQPTSEREQLNLETSDITSIVWCIGFRSNFSFIDIPVFNGRSYPEHTRGITSHPGLYFLGLPWLHTWGSGRFSGISRDAEFLSQQVAKFCSTKSDELLSA